ASDGGVCRRGGGGVELDAEVGGRDTDAGEADLPVGGDRDRGGPEDEVVDAASAGRLEGAGHLADDGAGLFGRQGGAGGELAEGGALGAVRDDEGASVVGADVEHPLDARVVYERGPARGVDGLGGGPRRRGEQERPDLALEDLVVAAPELGAGQDGGQLAVEPVAAGEHDAPRRRRGGAPSVVVQRPTPSVRPRPRALPVSGPHGNEWLGRALVEGADRSRGGRSGPGGVDGGGLSRARGPAARAVVGRRAPRGRRGGGPARAAGARRVGTRSPGALGAGLTGARRGGRTPPGEAAQR